MDNNEIYKTYLQKLHDYWEYMLSNKMYYKYKKIMSISNLSGTHLDFYHQPFKQLDKSSPDINFRNKVLKTFIKLNNLTKKKILISEPVVNEIISQCDFIIDNPGYWARYGYSEKVTESIIDSYKLFRSYLKNYLKNFSSEVKCVGLGKTIEGNKLYCYCIKYFTGFDNITPRELQRFGIMRLFKLSEILHNKYKSLEEAKTIYKNKQQYFNNDTEIFAYVKNKLYENQTKTKNIFSSNVKIPDANKIVVRSFPQLKAKGAPYGKSHEKLLFINTININRLSKTIINQICAQEAIPGIMVERYNTSKISKKYIQNKKIRSHIKRGICATKEGWGLMAEELLKESDELDLLLDQILNTVRIIVDIGLNTLECDMSFNMESAKEFLKKYTVMDDDTIQYEIIRYLAKPAYSCAAGIGYYTIKLLIEQYSIDIKQFADMYMKLPFTLPLLKEYIKNFIKSN